MNCQRVQDTFIDYQDGTLPADESAALRAHRALKELREVYFKIRKEAAA